MSVLIILISVSILVAVSFFGLFVWAVKSGQYEDTDSPSVRILYESRKKSTVDHQQSTDNS